MEMEPEQCVIQSVFLDAKSCGWSADARKIKSVEFPGSKIITVLIGDFRVIDLYNMTNPNSDMSACTTTIYYKDKPIWVMNYGGYYEKEAIPFLKSCLQRAYVEERRFYGGRGPNFVHDEKFAYINKIERNDFADFAGEERIFYYVSEQPLGFHWYRGMSLCKKHHQL